MTTINDVTHALNEALAMIDGARKRVNGIKAQEEPALQEEHLRRYQSLADHATAARVFLDTVEQWARENISRFGVEAMTAEKPFRYRVGDTVYMKRYPGIMWIVLKAMRAPASGDPTYAIRAADRFDDERGSLVWDDALT
jgi:hypothetical protein